ncbi:hypothetical protein [Pseudonocardia parietis]|uniref:DUF4815 domain-containing protein n=1 Tax=Pseudonocardia parietis TaxID=570936 RepID=A0ABS4W1Y5_9PSEU|nr:hypothetical protein [Pseudonocardia parietis]MBP2370214.1 hypothetical protein [Pseudonocardia parietis]
MAIGFRSSSSAVPNTNGDVEGSTVSCPRPTGVQAGDLLVAFVARSQTSASTTSFSASGWTVAGFFAGSSSYGPVAVMWRAAGSSEASSYTFTSNGFADLDQFIVHILAFTGASTTDPILVTPAKNDAGSNSSSVTAPSISLPSAGVLLCWFAAIHYTESSVSLSTPSGMTERVDAGGVWLHPSTCTEDRSSGSTGTRTATYSGGTTAHPPRGVSLAIREGSQTVTPTSIASAEAFGTPTLLGTSFLNVTSIASAEAFGTLVIDHVKVRPVGIISAEAFGLPTAVPGPATVAPDGIGTAEAFGYPWLRTTVNLAGQKGVVRRGVTYDLVMVARIPAASGPPTFLEIDSIVWSGLSWAEELSKPPRLDVSVSETTLSEAALQRIARPRELPSELHLYRGSKLVHAGPLMNWQQQGETLTLYGLGLLGYANYWMIESDLVFSQTDQFTIAKSLVDHWQGLEYGHYGIDTSQVGESGVLRDATYLAKEEHNIGKRLEELGRRQNGFDVDVDPITRALQLHYPIKGVDRSTGPDAIIFDGSNITSADVAGSVAPQDVASEAYGTGTSQDSSIRSVKSNLDVRAQFGRCGVAASFDGVSVQGTLDDHTQALLDARAEALIIPGPDVRVTPDVDPTTYSVGDTISYVLSGRLGVQGAFRLRKRTIKVSNTGRELASFEFA